MGRTAGFFYGEKFGDLMKFMQDGYCWVPLSEILPLLFPKREDAFHMEVALFCMERRFCSEEKTSFVKIVW